MKADYKNWVPKHMIAELAAGTAVFAGGFLGSDKFLVSAPEKMKTGVKAVLGLGTVGFAASTAWAVAMYKRFSYDGKYQLSKKIIEGTAEYVELPEGGVGLDVGCGSGALTIACARKNPQGKMIGLDRWGLDYSNYSKKLCENNARAEGVTNAEFVKGNAVRLDFADETFDAVTSNYVYHNISGVNRQKLLRETLRVLKKGGTFAIHDIMSKTRYGDMEKFMDELRAEGYEDVKMIPTDRGMFVNHRDALWMDLSGSCLLVGRK